MGCYWINIYDTHGVENCSNLPCSQVNLDYLAGDVAICEDSLECGNPFHLKNGCHVYENGVRLTAETTLKLGVPCCGPCSQLDDDVNGDRADVCIKRWPDCRNNGGRAGFTDGTAQRFGPQIGGPCPIPDGCRTTWPIYREAHNPDSGYQNALCRVGRCCATVEFYGFNDIDPPYVDPCRPRYGHFPEEGTCVCATCQRCLGAATEESCEAYVGRIITDVLSDSVFQCNYPSGFPEAFAAGRVIDVSWDDESFICEDNFCDANRCHEPGGGFGLVCCAPDPSDGTRAICFRSSSIHARNYCELIGGTVSQSLHCDCAEFLCGDQNVYPYGGEYDGIFERDADVIGWVTGRTTSYGDQRCEHLRGRLAVSEDGSHVVSPIFCNDVTAADNLETRESEARAYVYIGDDAKNGGDHVRSSFVSLQSSRGGLF